MSQINVELLTTWVLGNGPCRLVAFCSEADVGQSTLATRNSVGNIFGHYSIEYKIDHCYPCDDLQFDPTGSNVTEYSSTVFAVSEQYSWEQELMRFKLPLNAIYNDIM